MGRLAQCRYTSQFLHSCIRNCRHAATTIPFSTPVTCAGPSTLPHIINDSLIFLSVSPANDFPVLVGPDMSITQRCRLLRTPELAACAAEGGKTMLTDVWSEMFTLLDCENDDLRIAAWFAWKGSLFRDPSPPKASVRLLPSSLPRAGARVRFSSTRRSSSVSTEGERNCCGVGESGDPTDEGPSEPEP